MNIKKIEAETGRVVFFNDTGANEIYTRSLHDEVPMGRGRGGKRWKSFVLLFQKGKAEGEREGGGERGQEVEKLGFAILGRKSRRGKGRGRGGKRWKSFDLMV